MSKSSLGEAYRNLPDGERELPASCRALACKAREVRRQGRGDYIRLTTKQALVLVADFKKIREALAMCRNDLSLERLGKPLKKYGRIAQFRVSRKASEGSDNANKPKIAPKWAKVLESLTG